MKIKKQIVFSVFLFLFIFISISNLYSQQEYNIFVLEHFRRSIEYIMAGDYYNAIISCNNVIKADPNSVISYTIRARAYYELNEYDRAIADCSQAVRLDRNNAAVYNIRGNAYGRKGDYKRAISDWQMAIRINPNLEEAKYNIEMAMQQQTD
jgi:tetratricopeptide (TPR) repeat protein